MTSDRWIFRPVGRARGLAIAVSLAGWFGLGVGAWLDPKVAAFAYLSAFVYVVTLVLGALCLVMIGHTTHAHWFIVVRRLAESVVATLPVVALLFVPILFFLRTLYPWIEPLPHGLKRSVVESIREKEAYLNIPFFVGRAAFYFATWILLGRALVAWSLRQDRDPDDAPVERAVAISAGGLMLFGLTISFAAIDWVMSLEPAWISTVFGVYVFAGGMIAALAILAVVAWSAERSGYLAGALAASHYHAIGRLLLTFVVFWTYIFYSQSYLIWIADLPREAIWYLERWQNGWAVVLVGLLFGQFGIPFALLLSRSFKRDGRLLAGLGVWMLLMHYVDVFWLIVPALGGTHGFHVWWDLASLAAVGGTTSAFGLWRLEGRSLVPQNDPRLLQSVEYRSP